MSDESGTEKGYKGREGKGRGLSEDVSKTGVRNRKERSGKAAMWA